MKYIFLLWGLLPIAVLGKSYYLSPSGNDRYDGSSPARAWKTLAKLNSIELEPNDVVYLQAGKTFVGELRLNASDSGQPTKPVTIRTYGKGQAIIQATHSDALFGYNVAHVVLKHLYLKGKGYQGAVANGIHFYTDFVERLSDLQIDSCEVSGFAQYGILVSSDKQGVGGFENVSILHCLAHECGEAGIASLSAYPSYQHKNFYLAYNKAFHNQGLLHKTENHSGNGIVMGGIDELLIEYCEAWENGAFCRCTGGGPCGIWMWMCRNGVIQYCESHHNHAGLTKDGAGFDIDGGATHCVLRYNYAHHNEGAGYLLAEFGAPAPFLFENNEIHDNISLNDGRKNSYGGISIWGAGAEFKVINCKIYRNFIRSDGHKVVNGTPCAIHLLGAHLRGVQVYDNTFMLRGNTAFVISDQRPDAQQIHFQGNRYLCMDKHFQLIWGNQRYTSLQSWKAVAQGQE